MAAALRALPRAGAAFGGRRARAARRADNVYRPGRAVARSTPSGAARGRRSVIRASPDASRVVFVLKGYPRLSETFIAQEIAALERRGLDIAIVSLRQPTDTRAPSGARRDPRAGAVPSGIPLARAAAGAARLAAVRRLPAIAPRGALAARSRARSDAQPRPPLRPGAGARAELPAGAGALHAHFLHTPASVTRYAARCCGLPWTVSAHAKDIWTTPDWEKREKLADCGWLVTCTAAGREHLAALAPTGRASSSPITASTSRDFRGPARTVARRQRRAPTRSGPALGRPRRGQERLRRPARRARPPPPELHWRLVHIGGGPLASGPRRAAPSGSASPSGSSGAARGRRTRSSPPIARPISSSSPAGSPPTATATGYPTSSSRRRARRSPASRPRCRRSPS